MTLLVTTHSEKETVEAGEQLGALLQGGSVVLLHGDLGAGKTRFAKGIARGLGVKTEVTSPTFNLVLEYALAASTPKTLRHFDLYRLERADQLEDIDYFGLIEDDEAVSLVEWGSKFDESLPLDYLLVCITNDENRPEQRNLEISARGSRSKELLARYANAASLGKTK